MAVVWCWKDEKQNCSGTDMSLVVLVFILVFVIIFVWPVIVFICVISWLNKVLFYWNKTFLIRSWYSSVYLMCHHWSNWNINLLEFCHSSQLVLLQKILYIFYFFFVLTYSFVSWTQYKIIKLKQKYFCRKLCLTKEVTVHNYKWTFIFLFFFY